MTRGNLIDSVLSNSGVITLRYRKKVDVDSALSIVWSESELAPEKLETAKGFINEFRELFLGEPRTIVCTHEGQYDKFGRLQVMDVEKNSPRLVDLRTIEWAVINGVKHEVA